MAAPWFAYLLALIWLIPTVILVGAFGWLLAKAVIRFVFAPTAPHIKRKSSSSQ